MPQLICPETGIKNFSRCNFLDPLGTRYFAFSEGQALDISQLILAQGAGTETGVCQGADPTFVE